MAEVQQLEKKNLALEALRKLLNDEIRSRSKTNVVETKRFSERLEAAIARYHTNAISTVEVLQELINLAKDVRAARRRGEDEGLSQDEIAFYDALAENESAVDLMGNNSLKVIAHELLESLKGNVTVDWSTEKARARECAYWSSEFLESTAIRRIFKTRPFKPFSSRRRRSRGNGLERAVFGLNRGGDSRIGQILIQPVGWAEASRNAEAVFARLA